MKVSLKDGEEKWLLIHIEIQGGRDPDFAKRMFRYYYRIFDKYNQDIVAIALLTDHAKNFRPDTYQSSSYGTKLSYEYNLYKFLDHDETELLASCNPFAIAVLAANYANDSKKDTEKRYLFKRRLIRLVLETSDVPHIDQRMYITALLYFIDYLLQIPIDLTQRLRTEIRLSKEEIDMLYLDRNNLPPTFGEQMKVDRKKWFEEGIEEGIEKGLEKGIKKGILEAKKKLALKLIQEEFSDEYVAKLTELSADEIRELRMN